MAYAMTKLFARPDSLALFDRLENAQVAHLVELDLERVLLDNAEVGPLAGLERARTGELAIRESAVDRDGLQTLVHADLLILVQLSAALGDALGGAPHSLKEIGAQHRRVGVEGKRQAALQSVMADTRPPRTGPKFLRCTSAQYQIWLAKIDGIMLISAICSY